MKKKQQKPASNFPKRVKKSVHLTTIRDDVQQVMSKKTVSKDGVEESEIKMKLNLKSDNNDTEIYGPLRMAPDPTERYYEQRGDNKPSVNPRRQWDSDSGQIPSNQNLVINNYPPRQHGKSLYDVKSPPLRSNRYDNEATTSKNSHNDSYDTLNSSETSGNHMDNSDNENKSESEFEFPSAYKKKLRRLQKLEDQNTEDLASIKKEITTRFLITRAKPSMTKESVERYILLNFDIDAVYVRKCKNLSNFIFIINSEEELDKDEFEQHQWPGEIRCFFAPNERNRGY